MYSKTEWALKEIFDCGLDDLSIINDAGVDITDYIQLNRNNLSLNSFVEYIVEKANIALKETWEVEKEEVMDRIEEIKNEIKEECGEDYIKENPDDEEVKMIFFYENLIDKIIENGFSLYFNFLDTHITIPYEYELRKFFLLESAEEIIGFTTIENGIN